MESLEHVLGAQPFLAGIADAHLRTLAECASMHEIKGGKFIFRTGESADIFYLVLYGRVAVETFAPVRGELTILTLGAGDVLGWSWLVPPYRWHFDAHALDATSVIAFDAECLRARCDADPALGYEIMKRFAQVITRRLEATRLQLLDLYALPT